MWLQRFISIVLVWQLLVACTTAPTQTPSVAVTPASGTSIQTLLSSGFDPKLDGFSFQNYGEADVTNLTNADMQRMFGDVVCASTQPDCNLITAAQVWMDEINRAMRTGSCEGMAVLSQYFYYGVLKPQTFGGASVATLNLSQNIPLQREIAYWSATKPLTPPVVTILPPMHSPSSPYCAMGSTKTPKSPNSTPSACIRWTVPMAIP
jgi:hypothetical protein